MQGNSPFQAFPAVLLFTDASLGNESNGEKKDFALVKSFCFMIFL